MESAVETHPIPRLSDDPGHGAFVSSTRAGTPAAV